jgi:DNA-binding CsgD family transcriptional regulator
MNLYAKYHLSPKEISLCNLLLVGCTLQEAADSMYVQYKTASEYKRRAFQKMGIRNTAQLFRLKFHAMLEEVPSIPDEWHAGYRSALQEVLQ